MTAFDIWARLCSEVRPKTTRSNRLSLGPRAVGEFPGVAFVVRRQGQFAVVGCGTGEAGQREVRERSLHGPAEGRAALLHVLTVPGGGGQLDLEMGLRREDLLDVAEGHGLGPEGVAHDCDEVTRPGAS